MSWTGAFDFAWSLICSITTKILTITLNSLGYDFTDLGDRRRVICKLMELSLHIIDGRDVSFAKIVSNVGKAYGEIGDAAKQRELLEWALRIQETHYGPDHKDVASTLGSLGNAYGTLGYAAKQREVLERALPIIEAHYGNDHMKVARMLGNLGNAYGVLGDAAKQREVLERALPIIEAHYGPDHVEMAGTLANLGNAYGALGEAGKQRELLERALRIEEAHYGPDHVEVAKSLYNYGVDCRNGGYSTEQAGSIMFGKALHIFEMQLGAAHQYSKMARHAHNDCYKAV
jgi:tetratricopeptide (TPR) repeat protein